MILFPSESGTSGAERGLDRGPFQQSGPVENAVTKSPELDGSNQKVDRFPGNCVYLQHLQDLQQSVRDDEIRVFAYDASWQQLDAARTKDGKRNGMLARQSYNRAGLAEHLSKRFFGASNQSGGVVGSWVDSSGDPLLRSNAQWMGFGLTEADLATQITQALSIQAGFVDGKAGWADWAGVHWGLWIDGRTFIDVARWNPAGKQPHSNSRTDCKESAAVTRRIYDVQPVEWFEYDSAGKSKLKHRGWNVSHPEVGYLWGWDPKDLGDQHGYRGVHVGYPFKLAGYSFIVWVCFTEIFLECVAPTISRTKLLRYADGKVWTIQGRPKTSTREYSGRGQWLVREIS